MAVSYTHLDVYKRQVSCSGLDLKFSWSVIQYETTNCFLFVNPLLILNSSKAIVIQPFSQICNGSKLDLKCVYFWSCETKLTSTVRLYVDRVMIF